MTELPDPARIYHFTRVEHLETILEQGLVSDTTAKARGLLQVEVGNIEIKGRRERRPVPITPGGVVADYVPFYFAPRSPMMYAIHCGAVPTYQDGCEELIYLVSSIQRLEAMAVPWVCTDRNAVLDFAAFQSGLEGLGDLIDWPLMDELIWRNTPEDPARRERRMAECLVHRQVPWDALLAVAAKTPAVAARAQATLDRLGVTRVRVAVRPRMYF